MSSWNYDGGFKATRRQAIPQPINQLEYQSPAAPPKTPALLIVGVVACFVGILTLWMTVFLWKGSGIWSKLLPSSVSIYWAFPMCVVADFFGIQGTVAAGISLNRPGSKAWKIAGALGGISYLISLAIVMRYRLVY